MPTAKIRNSIDFDPAVYAAIERIARETDKPKRLVIEEALIAHIAKYDAK